MFRKQVQVRTIFAGMLIALSCASRPLLAQGPRSPVAPRRELVQAVVQEAYDKFKTDTNG